MKFTKWLYEKLVVRCGKCNTVIQIKGYCPECEPQIVGEPQVIRNATEIKREMLHELGKLIRTIGRKEPRKHGNYWYFEIGGDYYFMHDDYNNAVNFNKGGNRIKYFGIDWGGFETQLEIEDFENAIHLLKGFIKLSGISV